MEPKNELTMSEQPHQAQPAPEPKKRFRIEKLEERIAPSKGGNTKNNCSGGSISSSWTIPDTYSTSVY